MFNGCGPDRLSYTHKRGQEKGKKRHMNQCLKGLQVLVCNNIPGGFQKIPEKGNSELTDAFFLICSGGSVYSAKRFYGHSAPFTPTAWLLKLWSLNQPHGHHWGAHQKGQIHESESDFNKIRRQPLSKLKFEKP